MQDSYIGANENCPTNRSIAGLTGQDSDSHPESSGSQSKGQAGQTPRSEESPRQADSSPGHARDTLPESWDAVDAERPRKLRSGISPRDVQRAVEETDCQTVFEVTRELRSHRKATKQAIVRLDLEAPWLATGVLSGGDAR